MATVNHALRSETARLSWARGTPGDRAGYIVDPISRVVKPAVKKANGSIEYRQVGGKLRTADKRTYATWTTR